jgi:hypothetical protein
VVFGPFRTFDAGEAEALEREVGRPVPPAYRRFLETAGGGSFDYGTDVPPGSGGEILSFDELYRLGRDDDGEYGFGTLLGEYRHQPERWFAKEPATVSTQEYFVKSVERRIHAVVVGSVR